MKKVIAKWDVYNWSEPIFLDDVGNIYPEVEQPAVVLIKTLIKWNNLLEYWILECQSSDRCKEPAVS